MITIHKFPIDMIGINTIKMPKGAEVLHVHVQGSGVCVWAKVDTDQPSEDRVIVLIGTGQVVPPVGRYLGTAHFDGFVWHAFEGPQP